MTAPAICATPGCDNPVAARRGTTGRPPTYCSKACRLALRLAQRRNPDPANPDHTTTNNDDPVTVADNNQITVEIGQNPDNPSPMRSWTVTIHRGTQAVTVGHGLGRFAATALTDDLRRLLRNRPDQQRGHNID